MFWFFFNNKVRQGYIIIIIWLSPRFPTAEKTKSWLQRKKPKRDFLHVGTQVPHACLSSKTHAQVTWIPRKEPYCLIQVTVPVHQSANHFPRNKSVNTAVETHVVCRVNSGHRRICCNKGPCEVGSIQLRALSSIKTLQLLTLEK
jgi:hypothetical protein